MNPNAGKIYDAIQMKDFISSGEKTEEEVKNYVPFTPYEVIEIKGCYFEIIAVAPDPYDIIVLKAMEKEKALKRMKEQREQKKD